MYLPLPEMYYTPLPRSSTEKLWFFQNTNSLVKCQRAAEEITELWLDYESSASLEAGFNSC